MVDEDGQREESDQLPEEGPGDVVPDDDGGSARKDAQENSGAEGEKGGSKSATGNPANAGQD